MTDKHLSGIGLGGILLIIGVGIASVGWMISETTKDDVSKSYDYYISFNLGLPQQITAIGVALILFGILYAIYEYQARRQRMRRLFCPYCGREAGPTGNRCTSCGGRL